MPRSYNQALDETQKALNTCIVRAIEALALAEALWSKNDIRYEGLRKTIDLSTDALCEFLKVKDL